jgi:selenocysteine lyase/cysteine desulfurase
MTLEDYIARLGLHSGGAIRASLGIVSNAADIRRFADFAQGFVDLETVPDDLPPRMTC